ncbi:MAG: YggS family pyridoxal phosphate-dependent enzyme [Bacteroidia bacterium]|nr:YggS family pyridoxal phosphate-dependent enzyme [Bacteroidia bacterium]
MTAIPQNLKKILDAMPEQVTLIAVSKTKSPEEIMQAYEAGQRDFGENKIQELVWKQEELPQDIRWHMIGHVQRNKVKYMASFVHLIHGVDSLKLLREINKQGAKHNRVITCLLQVHIAEEESKFGLDETELMALLKNLPGESLENIAIIGLMGMATFTDDQEQLAAEFKYLSDLKTRLASEYPELKELSMGMSGDYQLAVKYGSTMVRIGSSIFGSRK